MAAQVVSLFQRPAPVRDWSQQELAEFYRVENALLQAGLRIETERGLTDDGEPWFAFCRADDGEVFIHFARIGGQYIVAGPAYDGVAKGWDFAALVRDLISRHPLVSPAGPQRKSNIFMHPAALLIAVVGTAFFKTGEAKADDGRGESETGAHRRLTITKAIGVAVGGQAATPVVVDAHQTLMLVASAIASLERGGYAATGDENLSLAERLKSDAALERSWIGDSRQLAAPLAPSADPAKLAAPFMASAAEVSSWLSLAVVLSDLRADGEGSAAPGLPAGPDIASEVLIEAPAAQIEALGASAAAIASSFLVVDLTSDALPDVEAIRLLRSIDAGLGLQTKVILVDELPAFLAEFLPQARHLDFEEAPPQQAVVQPVVDDTLQAPVDAGPPAVDSGGTIVDTDPLLDAGSALPQPEPTDSAPADVAPAIEPPQLELTVDQATFVSAMQHFFRSTANVEVVVKGDDVYLYDKLITWGLLDGDQVQSVTRTFDDGSTLTLVGTHEAVYDPWGPG